MPRDRQAEGVLQRRGRAVSLSFPRLRSAAQEAVHGRVTAATRVGLVDTSGNDVMMKARAMIAREIADGL